MTVKEAIRIWEKHFGVRDSRPMLDEYFYSLSLFTIQNNLMISFNEIENWCSEHLEEENWHRIYSKI